MKFIAGLIGAVILASAGVAVAGEGNDDGCPGNSCHGGSAAATSNATAVSVSSVEASVSNREASNPASSAAGLFLANCTSGASAQGFGGGGSLGGPDDVCLLLNLSQVAAIEGDQATAQAALKRAENILTIRTNPVVRYLQAIPVLRHIF